MTSMTAAEPQRFSFSTSTGARLVGYRWPAGSAPLPAPSDAQAGPGPLIMVHGFGEHARRHGGLARAAAAAGRDVYAFDQEGHGESPGKRAIVKGYASALAAIAALVDRRAGGDDGAVHVGRPVLFGHSTGGAIALDYALNNPDRLAALILSAPALIDAVKRPAWLLSLAGPLARLAPALPVAQLDVTRISRDPAEVKRYRDDPLIHHGGVPAVTGFSITSQGAELLRRAGSLKVPTLVVHGEADGIMDVDGSRRLAAGAPTDIVELHTFPGAYHELHHDDASSGVREQVLDVELAFLARYRARAQPVMR